MGLNIAEHGASTELYDVLTQMEHQRMSGDFSSPIEVEPGSEVGQIGLQYNRVLAQVTWEQQIQKQMALATEKAHREAVRSALELAKNEKNTRKILECAGEGILTLDGNGLIASMNSAAAEIFLCDNEAARDQSIS